jgi:hypothetical protein
MVGRAMGRFTLEFDHDHSAGPQIYRSCPDVKDRGKLEPVVTRCVIMVATEATIDQTDERSLSTP